MNDTMKKSNSRRHFLQSTAQASAFVALHHATPLTAQPSPFALEEVTVNELQAGLQSGKYTTRAITEMYLSRITATDPTTTNAVIELNPDALAIAAQLDRERQAGNVRGTTILGI